MNRRNLLTKGILTAGTVVSTMASAQAAKLCGLTSEQPEGPFYPIADQMDKNNDLTILNSNTNKTARGEKVILNGVVRDENCRPVKGALVEIWQACDTGKYNHPGDPNTASLDPDFQYWGQTLTDEQGRYSFKTIKPGAYPATNTWVRPPHIHMKVNLRGFEELTTQAYFAEEKQLNAGDRILQGLNSEDQAACTVKFINESPFQQNIRIGTFDVFIKGIK